MRWRDVIIPVLCVIVAVALMFTASWQLEHINSQRAEMKLVSNEPLENAPPSLAFATVAMGAFRGLVVDILWIRADNLKEKGQFFDAKQLAEWITVLQPRFEDVWEFQSWNMAYNISVAIPNTQPGERWRWVRNGYELVRDKGIVKNPKSIKLYRQLAWIFQHKIGGVTDDAHRYYKRQIAVEMEPLLGENPSMEYFVELANAPKDIDGILEDERINSFVNEVVKYDETFRDKEKICSRYLVLRRGPADFDPNVFDVVEKYINSEDNPLPKFDIYARAYQLRNVWKLEPDLMDECNRLYGPVVGDVNDPNDRRPLDWRHPDVHAIYWAQKGLEIAGGDPDSIDELNADRIVFHSLQSLFRTGNIYIYDEPVEVESKDMLGGEKMVTTVRKSLFQRPDTRMFESYDAATVRAIEKYAPGGIADTRVQSVKNGHRNMLKNAVLLFYQANQVEKAGEIYLRLRELYGEREEFKVGLRQFCRDRLVEELESIGINDAREIVLSLLSEAYFRYALGDDEEAMGREKMAQEVYNKYQKEFESEAEEGIDRVLLPEMSRLRFLALLDFSYNVTYPPRMRELLFNRIKVEKPKLFEQLEEQGKLFKEELEKRRELEENK